MKLTENDIQNFINELENGKKLQVFLCGRQCNLIKKNGSEYYNISNTYTCYESKENLILNLRKSINSGLEFEFKITGKGKKIKDLIK